MFNEYVILHTPNTHTDEQPAQPQQQQQQPQQQSQLQQALQQSSSTTYKSVVSSEKTTQAGDGNIWQVNLGQNMCSHTLSNMLTDCSDLNFNDAMTCQELLAFSVAFSAALPTSQNTLESFYSSLARSDPPALENYSANAASSSGGGIAAVDTTNSGNGRSTTHHHDYSCCYELYQNAAHIEAMQREQQSRNKFIRSITGTWRIIRKALGLARRYIRILVEHKYFQQGILLAILINTLSMGIEYHDQPEELTVIVETSNIVFSGIFAVEMLLKVVAEGPFRYIANGFNVFDGVIVILR